MKDINNNIGDILFCNKLEKHYLLLEKTPTDLNSWTSLSLEDGAIVLVFGIGPTIYQSDMRWKKVA